MFVFSAHLRSARIEKQLGLTYLQQNPYVPSRQVVSDGSDGFAYSSPPWAQWACKSEPYHEYGLVFALPIRPCTMALFVSQEYGVPWSTVLCAAAPICSGVAVQRGTYYGATAMRRKGYCIDIAVPVQTKNQFLT